jgi:hypothetical protein
MVEIEDDQEIEVTGTVVCPHCHKEHEATVTDMVHVVIDYEPDDGSWRD